MKALAVFISVVLLALLICGVWTAIVGSNNVAYPEAADLKQSAGKPYMPLEEEPFFEIIIKDKVSEAMYIETAGGLAPLYNSDGSVLMYEDWLKEETNDSH